MLHLQSCLWSDVCQLIIFLYEPGMEKSYFSSVDHEPSGIYIFSRFFLVFSFGFQPSPLLCLLGLLPFQPHTCFDLRRVPSDQSLVSHSVLPGPAKLAPSKVKQVVSSHDEKDVGCSGSLQAPQQVLCDCAESPELIGFLG